MQYAVAKVECILRCVGLYCCLHINSLQRLGSKIRCFSISSQCRHPATVGEEKATPKLNDQMIIFIYATESCLNFTNLVRLMLPWQTPKHNSALNCTCYSQTEPFHIIYVTSIAHISQLRHPRRWCTFFKPVYFFPQGTRKGLL